MNIVYFYAWEEHKVNHGFYEEYIFGRHEIDVRKTGVILYKMPYETSSVQWKSMDSSAVGDGNRKQWNLDNSNRSGAKIEVSKIRLTENKHIIYWNAGVKAFLRVIKHLIHRGLS